MYTHTFCQRATWHNMSFKICLWSLHFYIFYVPEKCPVCFIKNILHKLRGNISYQFYSKFHNPIILIHEELQKQIWYQFLCVKFYTIAYVGQDNSNMYSQFPKVWIDWIKLRKICIKWRWRKTKPYDRAIP